MAVERLETQQEQLDADQRIHFLADLKLLCQTITNFLTNAIKYSTDGGSIKVHSNYQE